MAHQNFDYLRCFSIPKSQKGPPELHVWNLISFKQLFGIASIILLSCGNTAAKKEMLSTIHTTFTSSFVKDSFDIYVTLPLGYDTASQPFPVIYYLDGNLRSGKELRSIINEFAANGQAVNFVFVGIGHIGNYRELRRRDFIIPSNTDVILAGRDASYGQAEKFYSFLKTELISEVEKKYNVSQDRSLIGHSLGGLFCMYSLFKKERLFINYVALSPSLWIDHKKIYKFEEQYRKDSAQLHANLYLCAGSRERFNYILSGTRNLKAFLEQRPYQGLNLFYYEIKGKGHHNEVPVALKIILPRLNQ